jgi:DNA-binding CsgD family transcriptional regulator
VCGGARQGVRQVLERGRRRMRQVMFTPRQQEVVRLVAAGLTDAEIAARLSIASRTARAHCDTLRIKLGVRRRAQIPGAFRRTTGLDPFTGARIDISERDAQTERAERARGSKQGPGARESYVT